MRKQIRILLTALGMACLCCGCVAQSADELYALPRQSNAYYNLRSAVDSALPADAVPLGPSAGPNQQTVQMANLDGDAEDEALVLAKASSEKPLKVYIFDREGETYHVSAVIEGDGSTFDSIEYVQLDGKPGMEILVGKRLSDQIMRSLSAYAYEDGNLVELMAANYSEYAVVDLDNDEYRDVFVLRLGTEQSAGVAELYRYQDGLMEREQEASMTPEAKVVKRIISGQVSAGVPAVFVASSAEEENTIVTDIFAYRNQIFQNVSSGQSIQTVRNYNVYAVDIDEDGLIELPAPVALPSNTAEETHWIIDWYNLLPEGGSETKLTTYHNYPGGWYVTLPDSWHDVLSISRSGEVAGVRSCRFNKWNGRGRPTEEIFTVYAFTGEERGRLAESDGRFLLAEKGETTYAATLGTCHLAQSLSQETLREMFRFIHIDWNSGER